MSDNPHCNFRGENCSQERSQKHLQYKDLKTKTHMMLNVIKAMTFQVGQQEPYQNNSENI
jgi:hypothetical protein